MSETVSQFSIHGLDLSFRSQSSILSTAAHQHLRHFLDQSVPTTNTLTMSFEAVASSDSIPVTISSTARQLFSRPETPGKKIDWTEVPCEIYQDQGRLVIDYLSRGLIQVDGPAGTVHGYIVTPELMHKDMHARFIHTALVELLKWKGLYTIHATSLEKDGLGVLIPGSSGHGKTTTFLSLLRAGYRCLSDDHPFIHEKEGGVEALAFPVKVDVTETTINFFPELRKAETLLHKGILKRYFYVEDLYPGSTGHSCTPQVLLFPHVVNQSTSWLEPISKSQALEDLLPQGLLVYDPLVAKKEFETLAHLVQQVDCYCLHFGQDVLDVPRLIDPILEKAKHIQHFTETP